MSNRECGSCKYFINNANGTGHCRRYPPVHTGKPLPYGDFPGTWISNWCGEYVSNVPPPVAPLTKYELWRAGRLTFKLGGYE